jgi:hypothetical protein
MILPETNQKQFLRLSWLTKYSGSSIHGYGFVHSDEQIRPNTNKTIDTVRYDKATKIQISRAKGSAKEKKLGGAFLGFWYKILIPKNFVWV